VPKQGPKFTPVFKSLHFYLIGTPTGGATRSVGMNIHCVVEKKRGETVDSKEKSLLCNRAL